jgi:DNA modification methylase
MADSASGISPLSVSYRALQELTPYKKNARTHSKAQIRKIADSIESFGFTNPVLIDLNDTIIAGHGRVESAKLLKMETVPTIRLESLNPAQVRAYVIADNRLAEDAGWDDQILKIELQNIILEGEVHISLTGFEVPEIDLLIGDAIDEDPDDKLADEAGEPVTRSGDLWLLGSHRVLGADVRNDDSIKRLMVDDLAAMVFTDPPYNVKIDGHVSGNGSIKHREFAMGAGEMSEQEFINFLETSLGLLAKYSTQEALQYVAMDWRHMGEVLAVGRKLYDSLLNLCVWAKDNGGMGSFYRSQHELIFVFRNGKGRHRNNIQLGQYGRYRTNVWNYPGIRGLSQNQGEEGNLLALHPTVKPVALIADAILDCTTRGEVVLDGFLGSGSTVIAAERVNRTCYGMEIDPLYVDVAIRRWQRYTGEKAILAGTDCFFDDRTKGGIAHG